MPRLTTKQYAILHALAYGDRPYQSVRESIRHQKLTWWILDGLGPIWFDVTVVDVITSGFIEGFWARDGVKCLRIKDKGLAAYCLAVHGDDPEVIELLARFWDRLKVTS